MASDLFDAGGKQMRLQHARRLAQMREQQRANAMVQAQSFRDTVHHMELEASLDNQRKTDDQRAVQMLALEGQMHAAVELMGQAHHDAQAFAHAAHMQRQQRSAQLEEFNRRQQARSCQAIKQARQEQLGKQERVINHQMRRQGILQAERRKAQAFTQTQADADQLHSQQQVLQQEAALAAQRRRPRQLDFKNTRMHEQYAAPPSHPVPQEPHMPDPVQQAQQTSVRGWQVEQDKVKQSVEAQARAQERFRAAQEKLRAERYEQQMERELAAAEAERLKLRQAQITTHRLRLQDKKAQQEVTRAFEDNFLVLATATSQAAHAPAAAAATSAVAPGVPAGATAGQAWAGRHQGQHQDFSFRPFPAAQELPPLPLFPSFMRAPSPEVPAAAPAGTLAEQEVPAAQPAAGDLQEGGQLYATFNPAGITAAMPHQQQQQQHESTSPVVGGTTATTALSPPMSVAQAHPDTTQLAAAAPPTSQQPHQPAPPVHSSSSSPAEPAAQPPSRAGGMDALQAVHALGLLRPSSSSVGGDDDDATSDVFEEQLDMELASMRRQLGMTQQQQQQPHAQHHPAWQPGMTQQQPGQESSNMHGPAQAARSTHISSPDGFSTASSQGATSAATSTHPSPEQHHGRLGNPVIPSAAGLPPHAGSPSSSHTSPQSSPAPAPPHDASTSPVGSVGSLSGSLSLSPGATLDMSPGAATLDLTLSPGATLDVLMEGVDDELMLLMGGGEGMDDGASSISSLSLSSIQDMVQRGILPAEVAAVLLPEASLSSLSFSLTATTTPSHTTATTLTASGTHTSSSALASSSLTIHTHSSNTTTTTSTQPQGSDSQAPTGPSTHHPPASHTAANPAQPTNSTTLLDLQRMQLKGTLRPLQGAAGLPPPPPLPSAHLSSNPVSSSISSFSTAAPPVQPSAAPRIQDSQRYGVPPVGTAGPASISISSSSSQQIGASTTTGPSLTATTTTTTADHSQQVASTSGLSPPQVALTTADHSQHVAAGTTLGSLGFDIDSLSIDEILALQPSDLLHHHHHHQDHQDPSSMAGGGGHGGASVWASLSGDSLAVALHTIEEEMAGDKAAGEAVAWELDRLLLRGTGAGSARAAATSKPHSQPHPQAPSQPHPQPHSQPHSQPPPGAGRTGGLHELEHGSGPGAPAGGLDALMTSDHTWGGGEQLPGSHTGALSISNDAGSQGGHFSDIMSRLLSEITRGLQAVHLPAAPTGAAGAGNMQTTSTGAGAAGGYLQATSSRGVGDLRQRVDMMSSRQQGPADGGDTASFSSLSSL